MESPDLQDQLAQVFEQRKFIRIELEQVQREEVRLDGQKSAEPRSRNSHQFPGHNGLCKLHFLRFQLLHYLLVRAICAEQLALAESVFLVRSCGARVPVQERRVSKQLQFSRVLAIIQLDRLVQQALDFFQKLGKTILNGVKLVHQALWS